LERWIESPLVNPFPVLECRGERVILGVYSQKFLSTQEQKSNLGGFPPESSFNAVMKLKNRRFSPESFVKRGRKTEEVLINTVEKPKNWGKNP